MTYIKQGMLISCNVPTSLRERFWRPGSPLFFWYCKDVKFGSDWQSMQLTRNNSTQVCQDAGEKLIYTYD